jgi:hypothetical protein
VTHGSTSGATLCLKILNCSISSLIGQIKTRGFKAVLANDHLIYSRPWLDAPTALATILSDSRNMAVGSVILAIVRGLVPMAKALAAIDILSNGPSPELFACTQITTPMKTCGIRNQRPEDVRRSPKSYSPSKRF